MIQASHMDTSGLKQILEDLAPEIGFSHFGWTTLDKPLSLAVYRQWLADGMHGEMDYLERHLPIKENPSEKFPKARTALVFAFPYRPHPKPKALPFKHARLATYAQGGDYHHWLKDKLKVVISRLSEFSPGDFETHTDSSPLLERDLATRASVGWVGKNTCTIDRKHGSFFLLGEILTSWDLEQTFAPIPDFCGTCTRCIDICPTKAITAPKVLDARKCISYLSIESRQLPPVELREKWGDWLFGCDLCQSVCPWNAKPFKPSENEKNLLLEMSTDDESALVEELRWILRSSGKTIEKVLDGTAMGRAGSFGLKRNALIVAGNRKLVMLKEDVLALQDHPRLGELAKWTLARF